MPFLRELSPHAPPTRRSNDEVCLLCGELALPELGPGRVSRLIGTFDTTAKRYGWQVAFHGIKMRKTWQEFGEALRIPNCVLQVAEWSGFIRLGAGQ